MEAKVNIKRKYRIGEVAKVYGVSTDILRHYDRIGLLKPEKDPENGYRYYDFYQLSLLGMILKFRLLNIPIEDIKNSVYSNNPLAYLRLMEHHENAIKSETSYLKKMLSNVKQLKSILLELKDRKDTHTIVNHPDLWILTGPKLEVDQVIDLTVSMPFHAKVDPRWISLSRFGSLTYKDDLNTGKATYAFSFISEHAPDKVEGNLSYYPAQLSVHTFYQGAYDEINTHYEEVLNWIYDNGYFLSGDIIESYILDIYTRDSTSQNYISELWFPITSIETQGAY